MFPVTQSEEELHTACKKMLKGRVFLGHYQEKRYVESIEQYRDIVIVSITEKQLQLDLRNIANKLNSVLNPIVENKWLGITMPDTVSTILGIAIWTEFPENEVPCFGEYWFQIKTLHFRRNEVIIKLKNVRPLDNNDTSLNSSKYKNVEPWNKTEFDIGETVDTWKELLESWKKSFNDFLLWFLSVRLNRSNCFGFLRFTSLLILSCLTGAVQAIKYFGFFTLRFLEEFRKILKVGTPFLLGCLDLLSKIVGGFYVLIAMIWRDTIGGIGSKPNYRAIQGAPAMGSFQPIENIPMYGWSKPSKRRRAAGRD